MSWMFLLWLISFIVVAALLGIVMYMLICLSDLENDFINPHDSAQRINKFVLPEMVMQAGLTVAYFLTGRWFMCLFNLPLLVYHARLAACPPGCVTWNAWMVARILDGSVIWYLRKEYLVDVTEIFSQLSTEKKYRLVKLFFYLAFFVIVIYRLVEAGVSMLLAAHGDEVHKKVLGNM